MKTEKECKGSGKALGYGCSKIIPVSLYGKSNRIYGLGLSCGCYSKWLRNSEEGQLKIERSTIKAREQVKKEVDAKHRKAKDSIKNWKKELQTKVQSIARLIDYGHLCIAREIEAKQMHGGHVLSKGGNTQLRFNLHNIHRQSAYSNTYKNDDGLMKEGIAREYGREYLDFVEGLRAYMVPNYSNVQYMDFYRKASKIANSLTKNKRKRNPEQRISMRNRVNEELGIYEEEQSIFNN